MSLPSPGTRVLGVFAKWPRPGTVKTRLVPTDPGRAAHIARAFLLDTLDRMAVIEAHRVLVYAPAEAAEEFATIAAGRYRPEYQGEGDLGERLRTFFERHRAGGERAVVAIGTDSPTLPVDRVRGAFDELERAEVVVGPATDGGYYLIGASRALPAIFAGVKWGAETVLSETVALLDTSDARLAMLPPWYDVDTPADWEMLRGHVAALRRAGLDPGVPRTEAILREREVTR